MTLSSVPPQPSQSMTEQSGTAGLGEPLVRTLSKPCSWVGAEKVLASLTHRERAVGFGQPFAWFLGMSSMGEEEWLLQTKHHAKHFPCGLTTKIQATQLNLSGR